MGGKKPMEVITMNKPTVDLKKIVADCEFEFWDRVATKHMPLVRSGDFDPMQAFELERALENAIRHWWRWNGSEYYNLKDGVDILDDNIEANGIIEFEED